MEVKNFFNKIKGMTIEEILDPDLRKQHEAELERAAMSEEERKAEEMRADARIFAKPIFDWFDSLELDWQKCYENNTNIADIWYKYAGYMYEFATMFPELKAWGDSKELSRKKEIDKTDPRVQEYNYQCYLKSDGKKYDEKIVNSGLPQVYCFTLGTAAPARYWKVPGHNNDQIYNFTRERANEIYEDWRRISAIDGRPDKFHDYAGIFSCCVSYMQSKISNLKKEIKY